MKRLSEDLDLWADLSPLDFDLWLEEELAKSSTNSCGKTSYEMMMVLFGAKKPSEPRPQKSTAPPVSKGGRQATIMPKMSEATASTVRDKASRTSKIQRIGDGIRSALIRSGALRGRYRYNAQVNAILKKTDNDNSEGTPNEYVLRDC